MLYSESSNSNACSMSTLPVYKVEQVEWAEHKILKFTKAPNSKYFWYDAFCEFFSLDCC